MNNNFFVRHMIKNDVFGPILDVSLKEARRDNLINCSCQEFFEHARKVGLDPDSPLKSTADIAGS